MYLVAFFSWFSQLIVTLIQLIAQPTKFFFTNSFFISYLRFSHMHIFPFKSLYISDLYIRNFFTKSIWAAYGREMRWRKMKMKSKSSNLALSTRELLYPSDFLNAESNPTDCALSLYNLILWLVCEVLCCTGSHLQKKPKELCLLLISHFYFPFSLF